jgi:glycosyltransferase 2 family protein
MVGGLLAAAAAVWFFHTPLAARVFDWKLAGATFTRIRWQWVLLSLIPIFGTYYGRALRWAVFLKPLKPHPSIGNLLSATIIGYTAVTLFGRPGEFVRPYLIARKEQVSVPSQFAAWVLERLFDLLMALLLFGFALTRVQASAALVGPKLEWLLVFGGKIAAYIGGAVLLVLLSMRHIARPLRQRLMAALRFLPAHRLSRVEKLISACIQGVESTRSDAALLLVLVYSVAEWILISAGYWCLARAFTGIIALSFVDVLILTGFVSFGAVVQIPGVGGGIQVAAVLVLTELFDVRLELATAFAILLWIITFVAIVPLGLLLALKQGLDWHSIRRLGPEASE